MSLSDALKSKEFSKARSLLQASSQNDVNKQDNSGRGALHYASLGARIDFVQELLALNADVNLRDAQGQTSAHLVLQSHAHSSELALMLLSAPGVNFDVQDDFGRAAIHWACQTQDRLVVEHVLANGGSLDIKTSSGDTPLHWAAKVDNSNSLAIVELLLSTGKAPILAKNEQQQTAADVAVYPSVKQLLTANMPKDTTDTDDFNFADDVKDDTPVQSNVSMSATSALPAASTVFTSQNSSGWPSSGSSSSAFASKSKSGPSTTSSAGASTASGPLKKRPKMAIKMKRKK